MPSAAAVAHSPPRSAVLARCAVTSDEEHAVSAPNVQNLDVISTVLAFGIRNFVMQTIGRRPESLKPGALKFCGSCLWLTSSKLKALNIEDPSHSPTVTAGPLKPKVKEMRPDAALRCAPVA